MNAQISTELSTHPYTIRKINLLPLAKFGFVLGAVAMCLPGLICAWGGTQLVALARHWLDNLQSGGQLDLGLLQLAGFNLIDMFGLTGLQLMLASLDDQRLMVGLLLLLTGIIGGGLLVGLTVLLVGWVYNLLAAITGGLEVELRA